MKPETAVNESAAGAFLHSPLPTLTDFLFGVLLFIFSPGWDYGNLQASKLCLYKTPPVFTTFIRQTYGNFVLS